MLQGPLNHSEALQSDLAPLSSASLSRASCKDTWPCVLCNLLANGHCRFATRLGGTLAVFGNGHAIKTIAGAVAQHPACDHTQVLKSTVLVIKKTFAAIFDPGFSGLHTRSVIVKKALVDDLAVVRDLVEIVEYSAETAVLGVEDETEVLQRKVIGQPW